MTTQIKTNYLHDAKPIDRIIRWQGLYKVAGTAGTMTGIVFLAGMISLIVSVLRPGVSDSPWLSFQNIWLIVIFKLHAGFSGVDIGLLHVLNVLDLALLAIVGTMYLGLYTALKRTSKFWSIVAAIQPFLGIATFLVTENAGRSAAMGAALVISIVMLRSDLFNKATAYLGILASVLLLVGDFSAGVIPPMAGMATLVGTGYVFLVIWFFLMARKLFQLSSGARDEAK